MQGKSDSASEKFKKMVVEETCPQWEEELSENDCDDSTERNDMLDGTGRLGDIGDAEETEVGGTQGNEKELDGQDGERLEEHDCDYHEEAAGGREGDDTEEEDSAILCETPKNFDADLCCSLCGRHIRRCTSE